MTHHIKSYCAIVLLLLLTGCITAEDNILASAGLGLLSTAPNNSLRETNALNAASNAFAATARHQSNVETARAGKTDVNVNVDGGGSTLPPTGYHDGKWPKESYYKGQTKDIDLNSAMRMIDAGLKEAKKLKVNMNIAVLDRGGNLKAFVRMDDAFLGSADIAQKKAKTSLLFHAPSGALGAMAKPDGPLYGIENSNGGLILFAGGLPIQDNQGNVIGSIGVSGSSVENDLKVAQAGVDAF